MEIFFYIWALARRKWMILGVSFVAAAGVFVFTFLQDRSFLSKAQYSTGLTMQGAVVKEDFNVFEIDVKFNNLLETFKSPNVIGMLSYRLLLHDLTSKAPYQQLTEKQKAKAAELKLNPANAIKILSDKLDSLQLLNTSNENEYKLLKLLEVHKYDFESVVAKLSITRVQRTDYIDVSFRSTSPFMSAYVVNQIGQDFLRYFNSLSNVRSEESIQTLNRQLQLKAKEFDSSFNALQSTKVGLGTADITAAVTAALGIVQEYETRLADEKANYNRDIAQLNGINDELARMTPSSAAVNAKSEAQVLRRQIALLQAELNEKGGSDATISDRIKQLQSDLADKVKLAGSGGKVDEERKKELMSKKLELEAQVASAKGNIQDFEANIRKYQGQATSLAGKDVGVTKEQAKADIASKEYSDLKQRFASAVDAQEVGGMNFKQTLFGQPALKPESNRTVLFTLLAGSVTLMLLSFAVLMSALFDKSVKSGTVFERISGTHPEVLVPLMNLKKADMKSLVAGVAGKKKDGTDQFSNSLRKLRLQLLNSGKKVWFITSYYKGAGKSMLAEAMADAIAGAGRSVLIVDANFQHNTLTSKLGATPELNSLTEKGKAVELLKKLNSSDPMKVIGCEPQPSTPVELGNGFVSELQTTLSGATADIVLVELPAIESRTDVFELLPLSNSVLFVFAADHELSKPALEALKTLEAKDGFGAVVLNRVDKSLLSV